MWLTIQIAAGIVLAYVIIKNGAAVWRFSIGALIVAGIAIGVIILGALVDDAASNYGGMSVISSKAFEVGGMLLFAISLIVSILAAGWAIQIIVERSTRMRFLAKRSEVALGMGNLFLVVATLAFFEFAVGFDPLGPLDRYSRAKGWDDTLPVLSWLVISLWPVPIAYWLQKDGNRQKDAAPED